MGSPGIASLIAHIAFWLLLIAGRLTEELSPRGAIPFVLAWLAGFFLLPYAAPYGNALFAPLVGLLDIALVLIIFRGDVRLR